MKSHIESAVLRSTAASLYKNPRPRRIVVANICLFGARSAYSAGSMTAEKTVKKPRKTAAKKAEAGASRLRIRVRAYEHGVLDGAVKQIIDVAARHNATVVGPVPLPIDIKKYTVNRSSFIDKDSREQFEMRIHKRMIDILNPAAKVIEALTNIDLPSGVSIDVKMM